jgi:hypothetical protein
LKKHTPKDGARSNGIARHGSAQTNGMLATSSPPPPRFVMPNKSERKRITLIVNATLDHNIELFSLATGRMKTEIVVTALSEFLERHNIDPNQDRRTAVRDLLQVAAAGR